MLGVAAGILATLSAVGFSPEVLGQFGLITLLGGGLGLAIGRRVSPMQLPQTVAALHSVVGLSAVMTSAGSVLAHGAGAVSVLHLTTAYLGVLIGGVTFTGASFLPSLPASYSEPPPSPFSSFSLSPFLRPPFPSGLLPAFTTF